MNNRTPDSMIPNVKSNSCKKNVMKNHLFVSHLVIPYEALCSITPVLL